MRTELGFDEGDEDPPFEWPIQPPPVTSTASVWEWDGPAIDWTAAAGAGTIVDWREERRGR